MKIIHCICAIALVLVPRLQAHPNTDDIFNYFWANFSQFNGDTSAAETWYKKILDEGEKPSQAFYKGYIPFLFEKNDLEGILALLPTLDAPFENDVNIQLIFAQTLLKANKIPEAYNRFITLNNKFKGNQAIAFQTANIYIQKKEPENALTVIDGVLNAKKKPNNFIFLFLKAQLYMQLNNPAKALESVKLCLELQPHFDKGWLMFALLEEQFGHLQEAIKGYTNFLEVSGGNQEIQQHLLQLVFKQKMIADNKNSVIVGQPCFLKAMKLFEEKDYAAALTQIEHCIQETPSNVENKLLKVQILTATNRHTQAADEIKKWIITEPSQELWFKTLYLLTRSGLSIQKAIAVFEDCATAHPHNLLTVLYLADLNTRVKHNDTALIYHTKALSMTSDPKLKTKIYYQVGLIHHAQRNFTAMEEALEQGYKLNLNFPPLLNLLAHHYAQSNKKLNNAETLLHTALQNNKNNPHFLETQALIFYRKKEYSKALAILETIAQQEPHDFGVLKTLGKTYHKVGNVKQALHTIEQAMKIATHTQDKEQCTQLVKKWTTRHE